MQNSLQPPAGYQELLHELKERIRLAQVRAALAVNRELVLLNWSIERDLVRRFETEGWGTKINERLARDLQASFPGVEGFSSRNLVICVLLRRRGQTRQFCNSLLPNCLGGTTCRC